MERKDSTGLDASSTSISPDTTPQSGSAPLSSGSALLPAPASNSPAAILQRKRQRKQQKRHSNWCLFGILRIFAIVGPLGFVANIIYFQLYLHQTDLHIDFQNELHPLYEFSKSLGDRVEHYRQELNGELRSSSKAGSNKNRKMMSGKGPRSTGSKSLVISGRELLEQLDAQVQNSWTQCGSSVKSALALTKQLQNIPPSQLRSANNDNNKLTPFEWRNVVGKYLKDNPITPNEKEADPEGQQQQLTPQQCKIPQRGSVECSVQTYSIVVIFQGELNFRPLFMNLLSWVTYSAVADILVLMPHADWTFEGQTTMDAKYKKRIQSWHETNDHKVSMLGLPPHLDPDPISKFNLQTLFRRAMKKISSQAILFMDGSVLWEGNDRGINVGLELWIQNPHGLVATHNLEAFDDAKRQQQMASLTCPKDQVTSNLDVLWSSFCAESGGIPGDSDALHQQYQSILDLNGVFIHRDMLCLIQQPPLSDTLVQDIWPALDDGGDAHATAVYVRSMLATVLLLISGTPPLLFPAWIARPRNETKHYNSNWHYLPPIKEARAMEMLVANNTLTQQTALVSMLGYFGSGLTSTPATHNSHANDGVIPYWCASNKHVDEVFFAKDIPWMPENGGGKC